MNGYLYETHVLTKNLEVAIEFYQKLGMQLAYVIEERRVAFFWFTNKKEQMLGIWETPEEKWERRHFAFHISYEEILQVTDWLGAKGIDVRVGFGKEPTEPLVHCWMPAASVYFKDPDGNSLEYITVLEGNPMPELGVIYLSEWEELMKNCNL